MTTTRDHAAALIPDWEALVSREEKRGKYPQQLAELRAGLDILTEIAAGSHGRLYYSPDAFLMAARQRATKGRTLSEGA